MCSSIGCVQTITSDDTLVPPMRFRAPLLIVAAFAGGSLLLSCSGTPIVPANAFGTVTGTIGSSLGGGLASVSVVVTPTGSSAMTAVTTNSAGAFSVPNVPIGTAGTGSISVSGVPQNCQAPGPRSYSGLASGERDTLNITAVCVAPVDSLAVVVTSSLGGGVANVNVVVTPSGDSALNGATTNSGGSATFPNVGSGGGSIALSNVPSACVQPSPVTYSGKASGGTITVPITLQCSATAGAITGTVLTSQGNVSIGAGVGVIVTPHGAAALPAVSTNASGMFVVTGVPVSDGTGSLTFTNLPSNCPTPATGTPYSGLTSGKSLTVTNITITCSPPSGVVTGTISSSLGGGLAGVSVIVTPNGGTAMAAVTTNSAGGFSVNAVPVGSGTGGGTGTVAINHLTPNCTAPTSPSNYTGLTNGTSVTVNVTVTCTTPYGVIRGTIVTSWGEPIEGVVPTATPTGGSPVTTQASDSTGAFVIGNIPVGNGTGQVTFAGTPVDCSAISPQNYTGLTNAHQVTLYVVPSCTLTGAMLVNITGESNLVPINTANITFTGPDSAHTLTTTAVTQPGLINPLKPGIYQFQADTYATADVTVPQIFYADSITQGGVDQRIDSTNTVVAVGDVDTIGVTYAWRAGSGELWVADSSTMIMAGFSGPQLRQGSSVSASNIIAQYTPVAPTGMALDADDRLWTSMGTTNQVIKWRDSAEFSGASPAYVMLDVTGLSNPQGLAFDKNGLLWAANAGNNSLTGINESGTVTATVTSTALNQPTGMAFDATGNLWVSNIGNNTIVEFTAAQLATAGAETPGIVLSATASSLSSPSALAFDPSGNLWVTNTAANTVVSFATASLAATGSPAPAATISANSGSLQTPRALAFDFGGNLWVANEAASTIVEYSSAQLSSGGSVAPVGSVTSPGGVIGAPSALAFNPQPTNLPIYGSRVVRVVKPGVKLAPRGKLRAVVKRKR
jgi:sugar lactone lactonase YvrE